VTLFLALELINRELTAAPVVATTSIETLRKAIEETKERIAERRRTLALSHNDLKTLASKSSDDLRLELMALAQQTSSLESEKATLDAKHKTLSRALATLAARDAQRRESRQRLAGLATAATEAERELEKRNRGNEVVYNPTPESGKRVWIVVANRAAISACACDTPSATVEFTSKMLETPSAAFDGWLSKRNVNSDCFLVLARPEAIKTAKEVIDALRKRGFDTGFDLIGRQERVTLPDRKGAGS
jgi:hypothetical protein